MPGGRPLKFQSVEELKDAMHKYFDSVPIEEWTITGLALALDTSRATLMDYEEREEFFNTVKKGKDMVEHSYEIGLRKRGNAGDIFGLKNFGWKDKNENEVYGKDGGTINQSIQVEFVNGKRPDTSEV